MGLRRILEVLREPIPAETRALLAARWRELPEELRSDRQVVGRHWVHCGYTLGPAYCSFGCTHCYLPANANRVPLPALSAMKEQIDANRRLLGPGGGLQLTGGDVVDAYWRAGRAEELVTVVRHAADSGLVPMVMTHGQVFLENPDYLARLVRVGGLRKLALHVDITQAGRPGFPIARLRSEADLHPLREAFVELIRAVRRSTGIGFYAAHTVTVAERNLGSIADLLRWYVADSCRPDALRTLSFQTEAAVGRTRFSAVPVTPDRVWREICRGVGVELPRDALAFGHPDCSSAATLLVLYPERRVLEALPTDEAGRAIWAAALEVFGGCGGRGERRFEAVLQKLALLSRHPRLVRQALAYLPRRLRQEGLSFPGLAARLAAGRVRAFNVVLHNFMGRAEIEAGSETVAKRLAACSLRGAVRRDGRWVAVPMCELNAGLREELYAGEITGERRPGAAPAEGRES
jgi:hypothetical protein